MFVCESSGTVHDRVVSNRFLKMMPKQKCCTNWKINIRQCNFSQIVSLFHVIVSFVVDTDFCSAEDEPDYPNCGGESYKPWAFARWIYNGILGTSSQVTGKTLKVDEEEKRLQIVTKYQNWQRVSPRSREDNQSSNHKYRKYMHTICNTFGLVLDHVMFARLCVVSRYWRHVQVCESG